MRFFLLCDTTVGPISTFVSVETAFSFDGNTRPGDGVHLSTCAAPPSGRTAVVEVYPALARHEIRFVVNLAARSTPFVVLSEHGKTQRFYSTNEFTSVAC